MHDNISCIKINSFDPHDSLAVLIDLNDFKFAIACIYRSQSITYNDNLQMIQQISLILIYYLTKHTFALAIIKVL